MADRPVPEKLIPWDEVIQKLKELGFDGVELGGFLLCRNPDDLPTNGQGAQCSELEKARTQPLLNVTGPERSQR